MPGPNERKGSGSLPGSPDMGGSGREVGQEGPQLPGPSPSRLWPCSPPPRRRGQLLPYHCPDFPGCSQAPTPSVGVRATGGASQLRGSMLGAAIAPGPLTASSEAAWGTRGQRQGRPPGPPCPLLGVSFQSAMVLLVAQSQGEPENRVNQPPAAKKIQHLAQPLQPGP